MTQLVPAIIPKTYEDLLISVGRVKEFPLVQIDILDGITVQGVQTWPYSDRTSFKNIAEGEEGFPYWQEVSYEVHLMARTNPERVSEWVDAGVSSIVIHPSFSNNLNEIWVNCSQHEVSIWHAVTPSQLSSSNEIKEIVNCYTDLATAFPSSAGGIQLMGNDSMGKHGVSLDERVIPLISDLASKGVSVAVDIGVQLDTWKDLVDAGATKLISGSMIFSHDHPHELLKEVECY